MEKPIMGQETLEDIKRQLKDLSENISATKQEVVSELVGICSTLSTYSFESIPRDIIGYIERMIEKRGLTTSELSTQMVVDQCARNNMLKLLIKIGER